MDSDFEQIYVEYYKSVYKYLLTITKDNHLAEEITQETFYKALVNIKKYNPDYKMLTWLCTIAKNIYYSTYQKNKKYVTLKDNYVKEEDIINQLISNEKSEELLKIVHNLEEQYKEVFILRIYGELSFKQIGNIFSKTESWARVTYYRSKLKIKEKLDEKRM